MATTYGTIQFRRATAAKAAADNVVLDDGEPGFETDTGKLKVGDGVTHWNDLEYSADPVGFLAAVQSAENAATAAAASAATAAAPGDAAVEGFVTDSNSKTSAALKNTIVTVGGENFGPSAPQMRSEFAPVFGMVDFAERDEPTFTRYSANPVFSQANQNPASGASTSPTIYWPCPVYVGAIAGLTPIDQWYMYYTTNHSSGAGGVWLATAPSPTGPWTGRGEVFSNPTATLATYSSAYQLENASVVWNDDTSLFHLYYKMLTGITSPGMVTGLATSPDGQTWTDKGLVLNPGTNFPGDQQASYFKPFRIGRSWHAYHMVGGSNYPAWAISHSADGIHWETDPRVIGYGSDQINDAADGLYSTLATPLTDNQQRLEWNQAQVVRWNGQLWWFGMVTTFVSGGVAGNARMAYAPISHDLRSIIGRPKYFLLPPTGSNESWNYEYVRPVVYQGRIYLYYQCDTYLNVAVSV